MSKIVYSKNAQWWIQVPKLVLKSEIEKGEFTSIDVMSLFGQMPLIEQYLKAGGTPGGRDRKIDYYKKESGLGFWSRMEMMKLFEARGKIIEKEILKEKERDLNKIYDTQRQMRFIANTFAYLNAQISLFDLMKAYDKKLGTSFYKEIEKLHWFKLNNAARNSLQHYEMPIVTRNHDKTRVILTFTFFDKLLEKGSWLSAIFPWIKESRPQNLEFHYDSGANNPFIEWAESHIKLIPQEKRFSIIVGSTSNGSLKFSEMSLGDILKYKK